MKPNIKKTLSWLPKGTIRQISNYNSRIKRKMFYKGILILLISMPSFAGNNKQGAGKPCPAMMKCMMKCMEAKAAEETIETGIQPADLATTVLCRFLI